MLRIRPYRTNDSKQIACWCRDSISFYQWSEGRLGDFPVSPERIEQAVSGRIDNEKYFPFTAFDETGAVGFFTLRQPGEDPEELSFGYVILRPESRGKGYGKQMLKLGIKFAFELYGIKAAFKPFYKDTILFETITPSDIRAMDRVIEEHDFLDYDDIVEFNGFLYQESRSTRDKQQMWFLLDKALKVITQRPEKEQREIKKDIKSFLKSYCFLIQATAYENIELHRRYNFLSYLVKELNPGGGGNNFDIADKITVTGFKPEKQKSIKVRQSKLNQK